MQPWFHGSRPASARPPLFPATRPLIHLRSLLATGLEALETLGGISAVQDHVDAVGQYLYEELARLKHSNGEPVVRVFGKHHLPNR